MLKFLQNLLTTLSEGEVVRLKYWIKVEDVGVTHYVDVVANVFGARLNATLKYDGETVQMLDGDIILDRVIHDVWKHVMAQLDRDDGVKVSRGEGLSTVDVENTPEVPIPTELDGFIPVNGGYCVTCGRELPNHDYVANHMMVGHFVKVRDYEPSMAEEAAKTAPLSPISPNVEEGVVGESGNTTTACSEPQFDVESTVERENYYG